MEELYAKLTALLGLVLVALAFVPTVLTPISLVLGVDLGVLAVVFVAMGAVLAMAGGAMSPAASPIVFATGVLIMLYATILEYKFDATVAWALGALTLVVGYFVKH